MNRISEKVYLSLNMPTEDVPVSDRKRILMALSVLGYEPVSMPLDVVRSLHPLCRDAGFDVTVSLVKREYDWVITQVEAGDQTAHHYGLAVVQPSLASLSVISKPHLPKISKVEKSCFIRRYPHLTRRSVVSLT